MGSLLKVLKHFLTDKKQRVVLNGQSSPWTNVKAGVPQGFIVGPFVDCADNFLFSVIHDSIYKTSELKNDLVRIMQWAFQWKMSFTPDLN